ncbi:TetR/AcrR family transcriptional regulator C-terminal domain-containing protein [Klebsiella michiganensis]|uniref:TetR/AcrR family transcriptional regulator C-terminal domain-containing protein n=1 Tax=Klebsiella michiganensis TaxID=1134687 RepID=A0AB35PPM2_9ENTR|nr:TetR/AcrR family transcriptional regulator C-terminal domain-containing protein [Klebsiella michiganensis]APM34155.1 TetR family transcriptional regulator [Klebsiella oxytoca]AIE69696.1 TetR family transcriptional regulator [Klebsiella michiganensis]AVE78040.1 TetR family transcriptional regulator [Klebsiella oxytoca]ELT9738671.1 TetR/AcrR family transcriptional regulator C-terminal domain-containing protein [Klebsiella michiganensis]MBD0920907.1 TetR family transcriptional regulator [Klebs
MAKIQRDQVIEAALALLDEVGLEAITTRKLAQKLGVESATLYWHFKNKASLLEEMASAVLAKHHSLPVPEDIAEWANWLADNARSFRRALLAHRDGALLHAGTSPARVGGDTFRPKVAYLARVGFTEADAAMILLTLSEYTLGCVLEEQSRSGDDGKQILSKPSPGIASIESLVYPHPDTAFEFGLSLIMKGLLVP